MHVSEFESRYFIELEACNCYELRESTTVVQECTGINQKLLPNDWNSFASYKFV